jgi:hypothetical protein
MAKKSLESLRQPHLLKELTSLPFHTQTHEYEIKYYEKLLSIVQSYLNHKLIDPLIHLIVEYELEFCSICFKFGIFDTISYNEYKYNRCQECAIIICGGDLEIGLGIYPDDSNLRLFPRENHIYFSYHSQLRHINENKYLELKMNYGISRRNDVSLECDLCSIKRANMLCFFKKDYTDKFPHLWLKFGFCKSSILCDYCFDMLIEIISNYISLYSLVHFDDYSNIDKIYFHHTINFIEKDIITSTESSYFRRI